MLYGTLLAFTLQLNVVLDQAVTVELIEVARKLITIASDAAQERSS